VEIPFTTAKDSAVLRVLHRMLCLSSKAHSLHHRDQRSRQDGKHLQSAVLVLHEFLRALLAEPRRVLNYAKRIFTTALLEDGLYAATQDIFLEEAIPLEEIGKRPEDKYKKFTELDLPRIKEKIEDKRKRRAEAVAELQSS